MAEERVTEWMFYVWGDRVSIGRGEEWLGCLVPPPDLSRCPALHSQLTNNDPFNYQNQVHAAAAQTIINLSQRQHRTKDRVEFSPLTPQLHCKRDKLEHYHYNKQS